MFFFLLGKNILSSSLPKSSPFLYSNLLGELTKITVAKKTQMLQSGRAEAHIPAPIIFMQIIRFCSVSFAQLSDEDCSAFLSVTMLGVKCLALCWHLVNAQLIMANSITMIASWVGGPCLLPPSYLQTFHKLAKYSAGY